MVYVVYGLRGLHIRGLRGLYIRGLRGLYRVVYVVYIYK